ncbi:acyl-CoA carboxylase subunit epsilon [Homoserinimonas sp. A447]
MTDNAVTDASPADGVEPAPQFRVLAGNPTPTEIAAVTAVLSALAEEGEGQRMSAEPAARSAWSLSQRQLRREIVPGPGAWNRQDL